MARARNIKPAICLDDRFAELPHWVRLLLIYLWMLADRAGRLPDNPRRIGASAFPYESLEIGKGLQQLHDCGYILRYEVGQQRLIQILHWQRDQRPHHQEAASELAPPPDRSISLEGASDFAPRREVVRPKNGLVDESILLIPDTGYLIPDTGFGSTDASIRTSPDPDSFDFEEFFECCYTRHPKKGNRGIAQRYLHEAIAAGAPPAEIEAGHTAWCESDQWTDGGGKFVKHDFAQWILDKGWKYPPQKPASKATLKDVFDSAAELGGSE